MRKRSSIVAAILFAGALALWFLSPAVSERVTTPLRLAFPVVTGERAVSSLVPWLSERHYIEVEFERNLPLPRLEQIVGPPGGEPTSRPQIDFSIEANGQRVPVQPSRAENWGSLVGYALGSFEGVRGKHYTLTADVRAAEPDLQKLNGQLFIEVHPMTGERFYFRVLAARLVAIIFVIVSVSVFLLGVVSARGLRRDGLSPLSSHESHPQA